MEILLIRHGDAVDHAPGLGDGGRWLTGKGRKVTRRVASWLTGRDETRPVEIWTSPLVRAVQTAEIVAEAAALADEVSVVAALSTSGDLDEVVRRLTRFSGPGPLALVGHEPSLSELATTLLMPRAWPGFKKSGVVAMNWSGHGKATFRFMLDPKEMHVITAI